jgi:hypothetical protein
MPTSFSYLTKLHSCLKGSIGLYSIDEPNAGVGACLEDVDDVNRFSRIES